MSVQTSGIMELISTLKKEGILEIEKERDKIINVAKEDAENIKAAGEELASKIREECNAECTQKRKDLDIELKMATRDFLLVFSKSIKNFIIKPIVKKNIKKCIEDSDFLKNALLELFKDIMAGDNNNILVLLNDSKKQEMIEFFNRDVFKSIKNHDKISFDFTNEFSGFQIIKKDEKLIWDFTLDSLTQEIGKLVEPHLLKYFI
jgi:vacuolar-type H+-ATPase subunit E/Vma4